MFDHLRQDIQRLRAIKSKPYPFMLLESLLLENGFQAVVLYRMAHWFKSRRIPLLGPLLGRLSIFLCGVEIAPGAKIGPGLLISHGMGIVVGQWATIGSGCTMMHQVTLGASSTSKLEQMPKVGNDVFLAAGSRLIGGIEVGDGAFIGANAVVAENVPAGSKVVVAKPVILPPRAAD